MRSLYFILLSAITASVESNAAIHIAQGTMVGEVDTSTAILHCRLTATSKRVGMDVPGASGVGRFEYSVNEDFTDSKLTGWINAEADYDYILKTKIKGLRADTRYHYRVIYGVDRKRTRTSDRATFRTHPGKNSDRAVSFVVVTGMNYMSFHHGIPRKGKRSGERAYEGMDKHLGFPGVSSMHKLKPDFFVGTGDNVYYDSHDDQEATDAQGMRQKWHQQFVQRRFVEFFRHVPTYWEKDDHDHRYNDCDRTGTRPPSSDLGIRLFREQVPVVDPNDANAKTYRTYRVNKHLQIWLVEGRDYRSPNKMADGPDKTLWGTEQIVWLKRTLLASDATFKLLISPTPLIGPDDAYKRDNHTNHKGFRSEGRAFFKWIKEQRLDKKGFYLICGDRHWQYHSADPTGIEEFSCGALVDANSRLGRKPGDPRSTDPDAEIKQFYTQKVASGGFLRVAINRQGVGQFEFYDENGDRLYRTIKNSNLIKSAIGVSRTGKPITSILHREDFDLTTEKPRLLLLGNTAGDTRSARMVEALMDEYASRPEVQERVLISAVPQPNPDKLQTPSFPPPGRAYNDPKTDAFHYLWRWIGMHAPDLVLELGFKEGKEDLPITEATKQITTALSNAKPAGVGNVPGLKLFGNASWNLDGLLQLYGMASHGVRNPFPHRNPQDLNRLRNPPQNLLSKWMDNPSPARFELRRRIERTPLEVATQLSHHYGNALNRVVYQPALALVARLRLGGIQSDPSHQRAVREMVIPYATKSKSSLSGRVSGSVLSGHLIFAELARLTGDKRYQDLVVAAADQGFDRSGKPLPAVPSHNEMSDAVFMACPILAEAGALTGERKYFDQCLRHLRFMRKLCVRKDGIYRHSPLDEAAWGRGNGFPALGLAWSLTVIPKDLEGREEILAAYREHLSALLQHQDPDGMWHQVIDHSESYRELTSTCMITFAMARGVRAGWLPRDRFGLAIEKAWRAIKTRVASNGELVDVCTGTGKQKNLRAYFDRTAILGKDERGGAMAMMVATEMAAYRE